MLEAPLGNSRFYRRSGPYSLGVVASAAGGVADRPEVLLEGVAPLQTAGPNEVSFLDNRRYASALDQTSAGAVIVHPDMASRVPTATAAILTSEPYAAWARVAALFYPAPPPSPGIHPSAIVADGALVDPSAEVGPLSVIETGAEIGPGCRIGPCAVIGSGVIVGRGLPDWRTCEPELRGLGSARLCVSRRPDRTGRVRICLHQGRIFVCPAARTSHYRGRCRSWCQFDD